MAVAADSDANGTEEIPIHTMHDNLAWKGKTTVARQPPQSKEHHDCLSLMRDIAKALNC